MKIATRSHHDDLLIAWNNDEAEQKHALPTKSAWFQAPLGLSNGKIQNCRPACTIEKLSVPWRASSYNKKNAPKVPKTAPRFCQISGSSTRLPPDLLWASLQTRSVRRRNRRPAAPTESLWPSRALAGPGAWQRHGVQWEGTTIPKKRRCSAALLGFFRGEFHKAISIGEMG